MKKLKFFLSIAFYVVCITACSQVAGFTDSSESYEISGEEEVDSSRYGKGRYNGGGNEKSTGPTNTSTIEAP